MTVENKNIPDGEEKDAFRRELARLLNKYNKENASNTPDFILAEYLNDCLSAYDRSSEHRDRWHMKEKPTSETKPDETDEDRLYREKEMKVEDYAGGFILADYSGKKAPALFCGESMGWEGQPIVTDTFATREEAVKAGMSQIDESAPKEKYQPPQAYREVPGDDPELKRLWEEKGATVIRIKDGYFLAKYVDEDKELYCGESMKWVDKMDDVGDLFPTHEEAVKAGLAS